MGLFDVVKNLLGGSGIADLAESAGVGEHLGNLTESVQEPLGDLGSVADQVTDSAAPIVEGL